MKSVPTDTATMRYAQEVPHTPVGIVEIAAHSLKCHSFQRGSVQTEKFAYNAGHDVYTTGALSGETLRRITEIVRELSFKPFEAIGTSVVRDASNAGDLANILESEFGIGLHPLTTWEEASLLMHGYLEQSRPLPALVADVGGGSVELVYLNKHHNVLWDSLPLGVIRLYHAQQTTDGDELVEMIAKQLRTAAVEIVDEIHLTGGTARAISTVLGETSFYPANVAELEARVRAEGSPPELKPERQKIFLPGLLLVNQIVAFVGAKKIDYVDISVGRRVLEGRIASGVNVLEVG